MLKAGAAAEFLEIFFRKISVEISDSNSRNIDQLKRIEFQFRIGIIDENVYSTIENKLMENPLFSKLFQNHYRLKEFTTEVLAGVLRSDQALLDSFVNKVLGIKGKNFVVDTQRLYQDVTVDMVFSNDDTLCFLEHTVQAVAEKQMTLLENAKPYYLPNARIFSGISEILLQIL